MNLNLKDPDNYVDITDLLFASVKSIENHQVVKSKYFDLLEGTRAVETDNIRLDTGMLRYELSEEELAFDPSLPISVKSIIAVMDKLYSLLMSWLNNSSLPVTILSCRYIQTVLQNYTASVTKSIDICSLSDPRIKTERKNGNDFEEFLSEKVLRAFILGLCKYVGFVLGVGTSILYEEEDLTTRNMDLDFLSQLDKKSVLEEIRLAIFLINDKKDSAANLIDLDNLIYRLEILHKMNEIESILRLSFEIEQTTYSIKPTIAFLDEAVYILQTQIKSLSNYRSYIPPGAFSKFVQLDLNNKSITTELYELDTAESFNNLVNMFSQLNESLLKSFEISNYYQFQNFIQYEITNNMNSTFNVFVRGLFQLFLIRDNKAIMGSTRGENILTVTQKMMDNLNTIDSQIFDINSWPDLKEPIKQDILNKFDQLLNDLESISYHTLSNSTNNRCRQRQLMSRGLLVWDTLQVALENFELEVWENFRIGDELEGNNQPSLPISSYIYYNKLQLMIDILFRGFELDLYKIFEAPQIYWYISYLSQLALELLQGRIRHQLELKVQYLTIGLSKKIKKLKAGDKKEKMKRLQQEKLTHVVPKVNLTIQYNENYLSKLFEGYFRLTDAIKIYFSLLHFAKAIDLLKGPPKLKYTSLENIYNLRMKPFSSIGVPSLPTFEHYKSAIEIDETNATKEKVRKIYSHCLDQFNEAKNIFRDLLEFIENKKFSGYFFLEGCSGNEEWVKALKKTCIHYLVEVKKLGKMLDEDNSAASTDKKKYDLELENGFHIYFPKITVRERS